MNPSLREAGTGKPRSSLFLAVSAVPPSECVCGGGSHGIHVGVRASVSPNKTGLFSASTGDSGNQVSDSGGPAYRTETLTYSCQLEGRF